MRGRVVGSYSHRNESGGGEGAARHHHGAMWLYKPTKRRKFLFLRADLSGSDFLVVPLLPLTLPLYRSSQPSRLSYPYRHSLGKP